MTTAGNIPVDFFTQSAVNISSNQAAFPHGVGNVPEYMMSCIQPTRSCMGFQTSSVPCLEYTKEKVLEKMKNSNCLKFAHSKTNSKVGFKKNPYGCGGGGGGGNNCGGCGKRSCTKRNFPKKRKSGSLRPYNPNFPKGCNGSNRNACGWTPSSGSQMQMYENPSTSCSDGKCNVMNQCMLKSTYKFSNTNGLRGKGGKTPYMTGVGMSSGNDILMQNYLEQHPSNRFNQSMFYRARVSGAMPSYATTYMQCGRPQPNYQQPNITGSIGPKAPVTALFYNQGDCDCSQQGRKFNQLDVRGMESWVNALQNAGIPDYDAVVFARFNHLQRNTYSGRGLKNQPQGVYANQPPTRPVKPVPVQPFNGQAVYIPRMSPSTQYGGMQHYTSPQRGDCDDIDAIQRRQINMALSTPLAKKYFKQGPYPFQIEPSSQSNLPYTYYQ